MQFHLIVIGVTDTVVAMSVVIVATVVICNTVEFALVMLVLTLVIVAAIAFNAFSVTRKLNRILHNFWKSGQKYQNIYIKA